MPEVYDKESMKEVGFHADRLGDTDGRVNLSSPEIEKVFESRGFQVYRNRAAHEYYIKICDYHAGTLIITDDGLEKMLEDLKSKDSSE